jgi:hypothetical protein
VDEHVRYNYMNVCSSACKYNKFMVSGKVGCPNNW